MEGLSNLNHKINRDALASCFNFSHVSGRYIDAVPKIGTGNICILCPNAYQAFDIDFKSPAGKPKKATGKADSNQWI